MTDNSEEPSLSIDELENVMQPQKLIELESGHIVEVFPVGWKQLKNFSKAFSAAMSLIDTIQVPKSMLNDPDGQDKAQEILLKQATPFILNNLLDVVQDTCKIYPPETNKENIIEMDDIPHWELPTIIHGWVLLNFGEKRKRDPWIAVIEDLFIRFTGKKVNLLQKVQNSISE